MKTILEWYEELPSPIKEQAIKNYNEEYKHANSLSDAIMWGFPWIPSNEGYDYWDDISIKLQNGQPLIEETKQEFEEGEIADWKGCDVNNLDIKD